MTCTDRTLLIIVSHDPDDLSEEVVQDVIDFMAENDCDGVGCIITHNRTAREIQMKTVGGMMDDHEQTDMALVTAGLHWATRYDHLADILHNFGLFCSVALVDMDRPEDDRTHVWRHGMVDMN